MRVPRPAARITALESGELGRKCSSRRFGIDKVLIRLETRAVGVESGNQAIAELITISQLTERDDATAETGAGESGAIGAGAEG